MTRRLFAKLLPFAASSATLFQRSNIRHLERLMQQLEYQLINASAEVQPLLMSMHNAVARRLYGPQH